jgi:hypothetical protein
MQVELSAKTKKLSGSITLDVVNNAPTYYFHGKTHSAETMADLLLEPVLSETGFLAAGRKIGFV